MSWELIFFIHCDSDGHDRYGTYYVHDDSLSEEEACNKLEEFYKNNPETQLIELDGWDEKGDTRLEIVSAEKIQDD